MTRVNAAASKGNEKEKGPTPKQEPNDEVVFVAESQPNDGNRRNDDDICELEHLRKLFIGGLAPYTTEESLKAFYEQWGKVVDVVVMRDMTTKRSRGFGFITYTKAYMVDRAQSNRPHIIDGKAVEAKRALARPEREKRELNISVKKLFVGGLKDNHDEECLTEYFSEFGKVVSVKILTDKTTGKRRGFAFIEYDDYDAVDKAILKKHHSIKYVVVDVKKSVYAQEKQNRQNAALAASNNNQMQNNYKPGPPGMSGQPQPAYGPPAVPPRQYAAPPMNNGPQPPQNYNYWGPPAPQQPPPPPQPQYYGGGYPQQPPAPQMGGWGYPAPPQNQWNQPAPPGPPVQPPQANWQQQQQPQGQWGPPPTAGPPAVAPPAPPTWNAAPVAPPNGPPNAGPPVAPPSQAPNFGSGYQQNYGGGPTKNGNMASNRMNPYATPPRYGYNPGPPGAPLGPPGVGPSSGGNSNVGPGPKPVPPVGSGGNRRY